MLRSIGLPEVLVIAIIGLLILSLAILLILGIGILVWKVLGRLGAGAGGPRFCPECGYALAKPRANSGKYCSGCGHTLSGNPNPRD